MIPGGEGDTLPEAAGARSAVCCMAARDRGKRLRDPVGVLERFPHPPVLAARSLGPRKMIVRTQSLALLLPSAVPEEIMALQSEGEIGVKAAGRPGRDVAVDLHRRHCFVLVAERDGTECLRRRLPCTPAGETALLALLAPGDRVVLEATTGTHRFANRLDHSGARVVVADPHMCGWSACAARRRTTATVRRC